MVGRGLRSEVVMVRARLTTLAELVGAGLVTLSAYQHVLGHLVAGAFLIAGGVLFSTPPKSPPKPAERVERVNP